MYYVATQCGTPCGTRLSSSHMVCFGYSYAYYMVYVLSQIHLALNAALLF